MVGKIHTQRKRKYGLPSRLRHEGFFKPKGSKTGARTFSTEDAAKKWASEKGLKSGQYTIVKAKKNKRFKIVQNK